MEQYILYLYMKQLVKSLDNDFSTSFNDMNFNKPYSVGIYIKGAEVSTYRDISDGSIYNFIHRVQFIIQGSNESDSLFKILELSSKLRSALIHTYNLIYNITTTEKLQKQETSESEEENQEETETERQTDYEIIITKVGLLGEVDFKGKTSQNIPRYSLNIKTEYSVKRKE